MSTKNIPIDDLMPPSYHNSIDTITINLSLPLNETLWWCGLWLFWVVIAFFVMAPIIRVLSDTLQFLILKVKNHGR